MFKIFIFTIVLNMNSFAMDWEINSDHSYLEFELPYLLVSKVKGRFRQFQGKMTEVKNDKGFYLEISSASVDTGNRVRDGHLREKDFFNSKLFPKITFISTSISNKSITGKLKFKNLEKMVTFSTTMTSKKLDTWSYENKFLKFSGILSLKSLGIDWNKTLPGEDLVLGDQVSVEGVFQLQPKGSQTPGFKYKIPDTGHIRMREKIQRGELAGPESDDLKLDYEVVPVKKEILNKKIKSNEEIEKENHPLSIYLSLVFLSLISFGGLIIGSIYVKDMLSQKYEHVKRIGFYTDSICIFLAFAFAMSLNFIWKLL